MSDEERILEIMNELLECNKEKFEYYDIDEIYKKLTNTKTSEKYLSEEEKYIEECINKIKPEIDKELKELGLLDDNGNPTQLGVCHQEWALTKRLMKERFNIDWKSPAEIAPWIDFD